MEQKYTYILMTENYRNTQTEVTYNYNKTKNIHLNFSRNGFSVTYTMSVRKDPQMILEDRLIRDAIRKATILRLIAFNETEITKLVIYINDKKTVVYDSQCDQQLFWLMSDTHLVSSMSDEWQNIDFYQYYVDVHKSKYKRRMAALNAFIMSKSKIYETEKFTYLWMTMAGFYGYLAERVRNIYIKQTGLKDTVLNSENGEIKMMSCYIGEPYATITDIYKNIEKKKKESIERKLREVTVKILDTVPFDQVSIVADAIKNNDLENTYVKQIDDLLSVTQLKGHISIHAFVLLWFAYSMRCNYFHSEKSILLFAFANESPIGSIRVLNYLLEDYLDHQLYEWYKQDSQLDGKNQELLKLAQQMFEIRKTKKGNEQIYFKENIQS